MQRRRFCPDLSLEGTPNVVLEAMASGVPVVSTDVGDVKELLHDGVSGFVVSDGDEAGLARRASELVTDAQRRQKFAANARRFVELNYSLAKFAGHLTSLYSAVAPSSNAGPARIVEGIGQ